MAHYHIFRPFILAGLLVGAAVLASCSNEKDANLAEEETVSLSPAPADESIEAAPEELVRTGDPATDDVEFVHQLGLIRGHLVAFMDLYQAGAKEMAMMHAKHPANEIYTELAPALTARGLDGFADELTIIHDTAMNDGSVDAIYIEFVESVRSQMPETSVGVKLLSIAEMMNTAGEEYALGVDANGKIINAHEYQDAYGFLNAAREFLSEEETTDINESEAIIMAHEQLDQALGQFPALLVDETEGQASIIHDAASRVERAGQRLL